MKKAFLVLNLSFLLILSGILNTYAANPELGKVTGLKAKAKYNNKIELSWTAVPDADGYEIFRGSKLIKSVVHSETATLKKVKAKKSYKYKVRAYKNISGQKVYGEYSKVVTKKAKKRNPVLLMVDNMDVNSRVVREFRKQGVKVVTVYSLDKVKVSKYDGLIIPGGNNMSPSSYGQKKHPSTFGTNRKKDNLQIKAIKLFMGAKKPILGICRGNQVINVALGGTLRQNVNLKQNTTVYHHEFQTIKNKKGYWMYKLYGPSRSVYQYHHQCIGKLGKGLIATSWSSGYKYKHIEAIEHKTLPIYGVQWHPDCKIARQGTKFFKSFKKICLKEMRN